MKRTHRYRFVIVILSLYMLISNEQLLLSGECIFHEVR